jgi:hypothetical protein
VQPYSPDLSILLKRHLGRPSQGVCLVGHCGLCPRVVPGLKSVRCVSKVRSTSTSCAWMRKLWPWNSKRRSKRSAWLARSVGPAVIRWRIENELGSRTNGIVKSTWTGGLGNTAGSTDNE